MHHLLLRFHAFIFQWRALWTEEFIALLLVVFVFVTPAAASTRLQERSLLLANSTPGATTSYTLSYRYVTPQPVGSVDMLFCVDPIPYHPCVTPPGLDISGAVLSSQTGETGFSANIVAPNHIVLSRSPSMPVSPDSSYVFSNIVNPTNTAESFSIRLKTHASTDATGALIDFGSVKSQVTDAIVIETQVPPMLIFCLAQEVHDNCESTNETYFTDMGELSASSTLTAQSQMAVGTNASGGFAITANGPPPSAGVNSIDGTAVPTESQTGKNQFGINLVENTAPSVGANPEGTWANAIPAVDYSVSNKYKYTSGDIVAYSPNVSLMKKFTVSYILNSSNSLRPGVYSTTINYIASGRF